MKKKDFDSIIESIASSLFEDQKEALGEKVNEWRARDNKPAIENETPLEKEPSVIDPKSSLQVVDENMPIDDSNWIPGNNLELGRAMKQMSEMIPEAQIEWFYTKLRRLIDNTLDQEDEARMQPRLG